MSSQFNLPNRLSPQQKIVLGLFIGHPGHHVSTEQFCQALYDDYRHGKIPAPAKLRVLIQRCRNIVDEISEGKVEITVRRNSGWKISRKGIHILKGYLANL